jgi:hypothetical protein
MWDVLNTPQLFPKRISVSIQQVNRVMLQLLLLAMVEYVFKASSRTQYFVMATKREHWGR